MKGEVNIRACIINAGFSSEKKDFTGFVGTNDFEPAVQITILINENDEPFCFAVYNNHAKKYKITHPEDAHEELLQPIFREHLETILLGSIDIEELEDERENFFIIYPDFDAPVSTELFNIGNEFSEIGDTKNYLAVQHVYASWQLDDQLVQHLDTNALIECEFEGEIEIPAEVLGTPLDYETESEILCLVSND